MIYFQITSSPSFNITLYLSW